MMPRDTNPNGTIFGGVLLSYIDQAGAIEARKLAPHRVVTVAIDRVEFTKPVHVGDVLSFFTKVAQRGRTSVTVQVQVEAERFQPPRTVEPVTVATVKYVSVDGEMRPTPLIG
jgi:acyl-CoA thioesterase YciA